ncbi:post-GPI attachment to proteins factor 3-like [Physella acuta]|uniref:post-GPI attachment to proteins factor 3-like n=1 Tax=Physella acuta TaxID=109671 RepID=UPI0027DAC112|nr:post-GPI attachment to proteins factor 3-like [Physella acuta]XP_059155701.1 post-GPI attachment to proteins factor 3-like [Physella acuta]XP_059155702.1 post-GPI attachment to proteins factor 3-like [Physella acuta]XP_059155703.1 post-GPI attachment to proteins factor 3-like [Physella acuta]
MMKSWQTNIIYYIFCAFLGLFTFAKASNGDRSYIFGKCNESCLKNNCSNLTDFNLTQPLYMKFLQWTCRDECKYECMWTTVDAFSRDGSNVPQFYGKWPFVRYAGIQEPASMIFSFLNGLTHLAVLCYRSKVPSSTPMFHVWHGMALVGFVTWMCATIFHARDTPFTEKMDYFSAFGLVVYNLFSLICRVIGSSHQYILSVVVLLLAGLYGYHIHYLAFVRFDYGYNMKVNLIVGAVNGLGWLVWCYYNHRSKPYVWKCAAVIIGLNGLLILEVFDFPPLFWTLDAHALWHAGTVPLNILWYRFITDDALYKQKEDDADVKKLV